MGKGQRQEVEVENMTQDEHTIYNIKLEISTLKTKTMTYIIL